MGLEAASLKRVFWDRVYLGTKPDDCWQWTGSLNVYGYGQYRTATGNVLAHLLALELTGLKDNAEVHHHVCSNRGCVNPDHLEPMTRSEHTKLHLGTHCKRGHLRTDENTYVTPSGKRWHCKLCARERSRESALREKEIRVAV